MKTIKYLLILMITVSTLTSCVEDNDLTHLNDDGPNIAGFVDAKQNLSAVSNGDEYDFSIKMEVKGPTYLDLSSDVLVSVAIDPSSTAMEGTHFRMDSNFITLVQSNNYLGLLPITVITQGIMAPLAENPVLTLNVSTVTTDGNVVYNAKPIVITFVYQCFADLSGTYLVTNSFCAPSFLTTITANPDGSWYIDTADGGFLDHCTSNTSLNNWGDITELCGTILATGNLRFGSSNFGGAIGDVSGGTWDAVTGILTMNHSEDFFNGGPFDWTSTYTRQ